ncbi:MAG: hypothetical protein ACUVUE_06365 [Candidatus Bathycorpusculaceae bacterium]
MVNTTSRKKAILASGIIAVAIALVAVVAYPAFVGSAHAEYVYALNKENWAITEETSLTADSSGGTVHAVTIDAKGYAFQRVDEETLKQFKAETQLTITIGPKEDDTPRVDVTGSVKVNEAVYTIQSGTAVLGTKRHVLYIHCEGVDEEGNKITLKFGAVYFWWGGKAYALRSKALLQTADNPMLLLQRGIAKIN